MAIFDLEKYISQFDDLKKINHFIKGNKSFNLACTSQIGRLIYFDILSKYTKLFILTDTEQSALKYKNDFKLLFNKDVIIFPYMDGSLYDGNVTNIYKYCEQFSVLNNLNNYGIVLAPVRAVFEKFPQKQFFADNSIKLKTDEDIDLEQKS